MHGVGLLENVKVEKIFDEVADGTSASNGTEVDMAGFEGVIFVVVYGTSATDNGIHVEQDTVTGMGSAADLAGTQVFLDGTETVSICQVHKPRERFLRAVADRGTSTTIPAGVAIKYGARTCPVDNDADTDNSAETHISPAEGTK